MTVRLNRVVRLRPSGDIGFRRHANRELRWCAVTVERKRRVSRMRSPRSLLRPSSLPGAARALGAGLLALISAVLTGCGPQADGLIRPTPASNHRLEIELDPRVELLGLMRLMSRSDPRFDTLDFAYARRVREHFRAFAGHPALRRFAAADRALGGGDLPAWVLLHHAATADWPQIAPYPELIAELVADPHAPTRMVEAVREFSRATDFLAFFAACTTEHGELTTAIRRELGEGSRLLGALEAYHGRSLARYRVIAAPLLHDANYGLRVNLPDGGVDTCAIIVRRRVRKGRAEFGNSAELRPLLWHEFGHSLVNPIVDADLARLAPLSPVLVPAGGRMPAGNYGERTATYVHEYLVRAIGVRLTTGFVGAKAGELELQRQIKVGLVHLPKLCARLEEYERARGRFPSFADFFPVILEEIATWRAE